MYCNCNQFHGVTFGQHKAGLDASKVTPSKVTLLPLATKAATEFVGTFFLCLIVALSAQTSTTSGSAGLAIGCVLVVLVYAGCQESGAHYNPAVTLSIAVSRRGKIKPLEAGAYVCSQLVGGLVAAPFSWLLVSQEKAGHAALAADASILAGIVGEMVVTFALCSVVLNTATTKAQANNSYYGLAIGFTVLSGAYSTGPITGGAFNPAVGIMSALYGGRSATNCWIYFVGPLTGGALAGVFLRVCEVEEYTENPSKMQNDIACFFNEMFGTMFLCYTVGTAAGNGTPFAFLAIGSSLMAMVYMGGGISGAHYNPAVSLAIAIRNWFDPTDDDFGFVRAALYVLAHILGAGIATLAAVAVMGSNEKVGYPVPEDVGKGFLGEIVGTFLLAYVVLNVATVKNLAGNSFFGLAIGMAVTSVALVIGPITGGAFNPAVGLIGPFSGGARVSIANVWIYWLACPLGASIAAFFFRFQNYEEFQTDHTDIKFMAHAVHTPGKDHFMTHAKVTNAGVRLSRVQRASISDCVVHPFAEGVLS